jgi:hypothetical protein
MDPSAAFFSSILTALSAPLESHVNDVMGTQPQTVISEQDGVRVSFTYQHWMIREASVCEDVKADALAYSRCAQAAKAGFAEACERLKAHPPDGNWRYARAKTMYCAAAASLKPKIAAIAASAPAAAGPVPAELVAAKKECSLLTAAALGNPDPEAVTRRDAACGKYRKLQGNPAEAKRP